MRRLLSLLAIGLLAGAIAASADTVTFSSDPTGNPANGFVSADSAKVSFTDSLGSNLQISDFGVQSHGKALAVNGDDPSILIMNFTGVQTSLSLEYGNDDPGWMADGAEAVLKVLLNGVEVGQVVQAVNLNDVMDQTIAISGVNFNSATFAYIGPFDPGVTGVIEVVDNVTFTSQVPEPATLLLLGSGLVGAGLRRRKK
jgi:hypothetical protein